MFIRNVINHAKHNYLQRNAHNFESSTRLALHYVLITFIPHPSLTSPCSSALRIENRPIRRNPPTLHIIHHLGCKPLITNHTDRFRTTRFPQPIRQQAHVRFTLCSCIPNNRMGIRILYILHNFFTKRFLGVRCGPKNTAGHFLCNDNGETGADTGARGDEDDGAEECGDA
jgi:hypothetical protein